MRRLNKIKFNLSVESLDITLEVSVCRPQVSCRKKTKKKKISSPHSRQSASPLFNFIKLPKQTVLKKVRPVIKNAKRFNNRFFLLNHKLVWNDVNPSMARITHSRYHCFGESSCFFKSPQVISNEFHFPAAKWSFSVYFAFPENSRWVTACRRRKARVKV